MWRPQYTLGRRTFPTEASLAWNHCFMFPASFDGCHALITHFNSQYVCTLHLWCALGLWQMTWMWFRKGPAFNFTVVMVSSLSWCIYCLIYSCICIFFYCNTMYFYQILYWKVLYRPRHSIVTLLDVYLYIKKNIYFCVLFKLYNFSYILFVIL